METLQNSKEIIASWTGASLYNLENNFSTLVVHIFWDLHPVPSVYFFPASSLENYGEVYSEVLDFWGTQISNKAHLISAFDTETSVRFQFFEVVPLTRISYDSGVRDEFQELKVSKHKSFTISNR